jgi:hypothetical protein
MDSPGKKNTHIVEPYQKEEKEKVAVIYDFDIH